MTPHCMMCSDSIHRGHPGAHYFRHFHFSPLWFILYQVILAFRIRDITNLEQFMFHVFLKKKYFPFEIDLKFQITILLIFKLFSHIHYLQVQMRHNLYNSYSIIIFIFPFSPLMIQYEWGISVCRRHVSLQLFILSLEKVEGLRREEGKRRK